MGRPGVIPEMADDLVAAVCCLGVLLRSALSEVELLFRENGIRRVSRASDLAAIGAVA
jgi:hypothetical protein